MSQEYSGCASDRQQLGDVPLPFVSEKMSQQSGESWAQEGAGNAYYAVKIPLSSQNVH